ncbi:Aldose 1-epimerase precursor [uncultured Clostridium sp.]|uniref:aldose epimerase family protein n=1 Tax=uncultured Clostridium sp. TaxID=59620 RepID=UPI0008234EE4|nr:aldose epimerase family protein [uncultured Clostridium sp.]SCJ31888.1 Aldose 1-epimerase precursor [uncultured Clostridium sp.]
MSISKNKFGFDKEENRVYEFKLENKNGHYITVLNYGATLRKIIVSDKNKNLVDVCLGYNTLKEYEENDGYLGAIVGRHANRIKDGKFDLNDVTYTVATNDRGNHLHGGVKGFDKYIWDYEIDNDKLIFTRESKHLEEGYPGNLKIKVVYEFNDNNELIIKYEAVSDEDTIVNLTNHTYFNLNGEGSGSILNNILNLKSSYYTENDEKCLPTGKILTVENSPFDFKSPKKIGENINDDNIQLKNGAGYDHNFILDSKDDLKYAGYLYGDESKIKMYIYTTCPAIQFYSGNVLTNRVGKSENNYSERTGLCLETQYYPNSMEHKHFPSIILKKNDLFKEKTIYKFLVE